MNNVFCLNKFSSIVLCNCSSKSFKLIVTAENDNSPIFENSTYQFSVSENMPASFSIGAVRATDSDRDTITYTLQPPYINGM